MALLINGRFLTQPLTGVQRFARGLVTALDGLLDGYPVTLVAPPRPLWRQPELGLNHIQLEEWGNCSGHRWEQLVLGRRVGDRPLLNLGNTAPLGHRNQWVVIHDAIVFAMPHTHRWYVRLTYQHIYRRLAAISHQILTVSEFSRHELQRYLAVPSGNITVVPNAADHFSQGICQGSSDAELSVSQLLKEHHLNHRPFVLAIAHPAPHKNFIAIARILSRLPPVHLVTIGRYDPRLFQRDHSLPVVNHHLPLGAVDDATLRALFARALGFIYPSRYEGFGLPPLEAMSCGCPVIASDIPALRETCGGAALYFHPDRPDELLNAIHRLHHDPMLRPTLIAAGYARASNYSWHHSAQTLWRAIARRTLAMGKVPSSTAWNSESQEISEAAAQFA
ncbi:MAG: glycosyltransferase family 4 protein [Oscillatoriales cyanobacterium SM2_2_1]|nr:glycosyltransferase family 4 protein [Oscillatoriales cyanobacterium SM2_2_1]